MIAAIGTWAMSLNGIKAASAALKMGESAGEAVERAIMMVEDAPEYTSVGYGGLPARDGHVRLDAAFMDGAALRFGGVMSVENIKNPIRAARLLCGRRTDCLLSGSGAEAFAREKGLEFADMRTGQSMEKWEQARAMQPLPDAYRGHDTVCVLARDAGGNVCAGTSTSGLFMKEPGRVGDSPIIGSGFYADARYGAAAATGLGEDIMRGCLSYQVVSSMAQGKSAQAACEEALGKLCAQKIALGEDAGSMSLIALDARGVCGAATTLKVFPFAHLSQGEVKLCAAFYENGVTHVRQVTPEEIAAQP